jgi:hypothetical protein
MASASNRMSGLMSDYAHLRTLPAMLSVVFVVASAFQFGAITAPTIQWGLDYTLTAEHATIISLATFATAFASSETKAFDRYEDWEKVVIAAAPVLIVSHQYVGFVGDQFANYSPTFAIGAFVISVVSWGVAVR